MKKALKWIGMVAGGLLGLLAIGILIIYLVVGSQISKTVELDVDGIEVEDDKASIERGEYLARAAFACTECHGEDLQGRYILEEPGLASLWAPNLTDGGVGADMSSEDWVRAVRHGIGNDGRRLILMPSTAFRFIDDQDLGHVVAFAQSIDPIDNEGATELGAMGRILFILGALPGFPYESIDHEAEVTQAPEQGETVEYGEYLTKNCLDCHRADLTGGPMPGADPAAPDAADLTPAGPTSAWELADFIDTMRTGKNPSGQKLDEFMPWKYYGKMTDEDLGAIWAYLQSLPTE